MNVKDLSPALKGHLHLAFFDGDVEREPLTSEQIEENRRWMEQGILPDGTLAGVPGVGECQLPLHAGRVVSKPFDTYEKDNLIVTTGKRAILDRLFALGGVGAMTAMGVGNSATAAAITDTQLGGAAPVPDLRLYDALPIRTALTVAAIRTYATGEGNMNWQEAGLFNGVVNGTSVMLDRIAPIGPFNKTASVSIILTVSITQS